MVSENEHEVQRDLEWGPQGVKAWKNLAGLALVSVWFVWLAPGVLWGDGSYDTDRFTALVTVLIGVFFLYLGMLGAARVVSGTRVLKAIERRGQSIIFRPYFGRARSVGLDEVARVDRYRATPWERHLTLLARVNHRNDLARSGTDLAIHVKGGIVFKANGDMFNLDDLMKRSIENV